MGNKIKARYLTATFFLLATFIGTVYLQPSTLKSAEAVLLPERLDNWTKVQQLTFSKKSLELLGNSALSGGVYQNGTTERAGIIVVSSVNDRSSFHPPQYCLEGSGLELIKNDVLYFKDKDSAMPESVNEMIFKNQKGARLLVWNWYKYGDRTTHNFYSQQTKLFLAMARGNEARGRMVTIYTPMRKDASASITINRSLCKSIFKYL
jgi:EpsI family protein